MNEYFELIKQYLIWNNYIGKYISEFPHKSTCNKKRYTKKRYNFQAPRTNAKLCIKKKFKTCCFSSGLCWQFNLHIEQLLDILWAAKPRLSWRKNVPFQNVFHLQPASLVKKNKKNISSLFQLNRATLSWVLLVRLIVGHF